MLRKAGDPRAEKRMSEGLVSGVKVFIKRLKEELGECKIYHSIP